MVQYTIFFFLSFFEYWHDQNIDHYARACDFGILQKKQKQNKKNNTKQKKKNLLSVFLTKWGVP